MKVFPRARPITELAPQVAWRMPSLRDLLLPVHQQYCSTVSNEGRAISLKTMTFLCALIQELDLRSVLDMGSGFSSTALRMLSELNPHMIGVPKREKFDVLSVDDNARWLEKSRAFMVEQLDLEDTGFEVWTPELAGDFDLVIYDLGTMDTRRAHLRHPRRLVRDGGFVFFDDLHKPGYAKRVMALLKGQTVYDTRALTIDKYERFGMLASYDSL